MYFFSYIFFHYHPLSVRSFFFHIEIPRRIFCYNKHQLFSSINTNHPLTITYIPLLYVFSIDCVMALRGDEEHRENERKRRREGRNEKKNRGGNPKSTLRNFLLLLLLFTIHMEIFSSSSCSCSF